MTQTIYIKVDSDQMDAAIEKAAKLKDMAKSVEREMNAACDAIERFMALADEFEAEAEGPELSDEELEERLGAGRKMGEAVAEELDDGKVEVATFGEDE